MKCYHEKIWILSKNMARLRLTLAWTPAILISLEAFAFGSTSDLTRVGVGTL
jgi:hypothetical protein